MGAWYRYRKDRVRSPHQVRYELHGGSMTSRSFQTKEEADAFMADMLLAIEMQQEELRAIGGLRRGKVLGLGAFAWFREHYRYQEGTGVAVEASLHHLESHFNELDFRKLTKLDVRSFANAMFDPSSEINCDRRKLYGTWKAYKLATVINAISVLRRVLSTLVDNGKLDSNPLGRQMLKEVRDAAKAFPDAVKDSETRGKPFSAEELTHVLKEFEERQPFFAPHAHFIALNGNRRGEMLALKSDALDFTNHKLEISLQLAMKRNKRPKWEKLRTIDMSEEVEALLRRQLRDIALLNTEWVFPDIDGSQLTEQRWKDIWRNVMKRVNIKHGVRPFGVHALRHTWIALELAAGTDPQRVANHTGDNVKTVYDHYSHFIPTKRRESSAVAARLAESREHAAAEQG